MNAQIKRPRRQRKGDRLLNPDARRAEIETDHAVAPFDRMAEQMDVFGFTKVWGFDINKSRPDAVLPTPAGPNQTRP